MTVITSTINSDIFDCFHSFSSQSNYSHYYTYCDKESILLPAASSYISAELGSEYAAHLKELDAIRFSPSLWAEGVTTPPSDQVIELARLVLAGLHRIAFLPQKVVATIDGISFCFAKGNKYADIEFLNDGSVLAVTTNRRSRPTVWEVDDFDSTYSQIKTFMQ